MLPGPLVLERDGDWMPNVAPVGPLARAVGHKLTWFFQGHDGDGVGWWEAQSRWGTIRAPFAEIVFRATVRPVSPQTPGG